MRPTKFVPEGGSADPRSNLHDEGLRVFADKFEKARKLHHKELKIKLLIGKKDTGNYDAEIINLKGKGLIKVEWEIPRNYDEQIGIKSRKLRKGMDWELIIQAKEAGGKFRTFTRKDIDRNTSKTVDIWEPSSHQKVPVVIYKVDSHKDWDSMESFLEYVEWVI